MLATLEVEIEGLRIKQSANLGVLKVFIVKTVGRVSATHRIQIGVWEIIQRDGWDAHNPIGIFLTVCIQRTYTSCVTSAEVLKLGYR